MAPVIRALVLVIVYLVLADSLAIDVFQDFMDFQHPDAEVIVMEPTKSVNSVLKPYVFLWLECEPCNKPGHICDPDTGRCVCPTGTEGPQCQTCSAGTWSYHPVKGCKVTLFSFW